MCRQGEGKNTQFKVPIALPVLVHRQWVTAVLSKLLLR
jgi:hypothetical protein